MHSKHSKNTAFKSALLLSLTIVGAANAEVISTSSEKAIVALDSANLGQRVCFYQGQSYSLGAVLSVGDFLLECRAEKSFESNGALAWKRLAADGSQPPAEKKVKSLKTTH
ncbi:DUF1496 domain-containing protein [Vibrio sp.]|uniref:DUF1496 domain-containing protein n=1 Tax=Vibrio sp. TaxID=678 RepID=UPI003D0F9F8A